MRVWALDVWGELTGCQRSLTHHPRFPRLGILCPALVCVCIVCKPPNIACPINLPLAPSVQIRSNPLFIPPPPPPPPPLPRSCVQLLREMTKVMRECWYYTSTARPTAVYLKKKLLKMSQELEHLDSAATEDDTALPRKVQEGCDRHSEEKVHDSAL